MSIRKSSHRFVLAIIAIAAITATTSANWGTGWNVLEFLGIGETEAQIAPESTIAPVRTAMTENGPSMMVPLVGTYNIPGDYPDLAAAVTDLNTQGVGGAVTLNLVAGNPQSAPAGGYVVGGTGSLVLTTTSSVNTVVIQGNGNTITASGALTSGALNDAIFKLIGSDWISISGFTMIENPANGTTAAGTNNMTEWGVALLYVTTTDGAQNNTIAGNTIDLNRTYQNTFGIYANATHTATSVTTSATATGAAGGNSGLVITANNITDVNNGIVVVGPTAAADMNDPVTIGGTAPNANTLTNFGTTGTFSGYANVSGTVNGILVRNSKNANVSFNSITSSAGGVTAGTINGIQFPAFSNSPTGTFTQNVNSNTLSIQSGLASGAINGINIGGTSSSATSIINVNSNTFTTTFGHTVAGSGTITFLSQGGGHFTQTISGNVFNTTTLNTTGSVTFLSCSNSVAAGGTKSVTNHTVNGFSKTGAGGTITFYSDNGSTPISTTTNVNGNTFSNITITGATSVTGISDTDGGAPNKNVQNNTISNISGGTTGTVVGITTNFDGGTTTVSGNAISNITNGGAITGISTGTSGSGGSLTTNIAQNVIHTLTGTGTASVTGVSIGGTTGHIKNVSRNKIYNLENSNVGVSTAGTVNGILVLSGTTVNVFNNLVGDLRAPNSNGSDIIRGLSITSTTTSSAINASFNSIFLNAASIGASFGTSGVFHQTSTTATTAALTLRNNNIVNTSTPNIGGGSITTAAFRRSSGAASMLANYGSASNNNLFYAGTPGPNRLIYDDGLSIAQTIAAYKAGVFTAGTIAPRDSASISENPPFLSTTGSSPDFLHINTATPTQIESGGAPVAGITDDFDGNTRNVSTPDIGADEFAGTGLDLSPPTVAYTALGNTASLGNRTLTTSITDTTGVPTAGIGLPVLYWRINAGAYTPVTATYVSGSQYDFTFGAGVVATDVVSYYIVAQDTAGTPNVGSTPVGGSGFSINPPAAATPPGSPSTYTIVPSISGTKTVGAGGDYLTLTAAIAAINAAEVTGPVILTLTDATYTAPAETFPLVLNANGGSSATNTITIVPASGNTPAITGSSASCVLSLNGADYVTLDGSNSGGNDRSLTVTNTNTSTTSAVLCLQTATGPNSATNNTFKNVNVVGNSNTTTLFGIFSGSSTISTTSLGTGNNSNTIQNNNVSKTQYGIYSQGAAIGTKNTGNVITQNLINTASPNNVQIGGIWVGFEDGVQITENNVANINPSATTPAFGITLGTRPSNTYTTFTGNEVVGASVSKNIVDNIVRTGDGTALGIGVATTTTTGAAANNIVNNAISRVRTTAATPSDFSVGLLLGGSSSGTTGSTMAYFNSVSATGVCSNSGPCYAAVIGGSNGVVDLRNNVFYNTQTSTTGKVYAIGFTYSSFTNLTSNYNDFFTTTASTLAETVALGSGGTDQTFASFKAATGQDASSINVDPLFNSVSNLQPQTGSPLLLAGTPVGGVTTDILGVTRNVTTPTIGAYETVADVAGPSITYTPLPNTTSTLDTAITASITDPSGVPTSGSLRPRVYFKRSIDASYVSRVCTYSAPNYNCGLLYAALPGAPVAGDTIQYFVIAQDNIGNVSSSPSGVVATNVNTVTTPPTPNAYNILIEINSYPYTQNFESGAGGYTSAIVGGSVNDWVLGTPAKTQLSAAHSGTNAWVTKLTGNYSSSHNAAVVSPIFNFTTVASTATISFWQNFDIDGDPDWDSMVLEASTDGGTVWNRVDSTLGTGPTYDTANSTGWYNLSGVNGPITGPEWTDTSTGYAGHASGWIQSTTKVGALAGQPSVLLRWRFASDSSFTDEGFAIDDVAVTPLVVAPGNLQLSSATYSGNENTTLNVDVNRVSGSAGTVGVTATLADVSATGGAACTAGVDYINPGPQNLTFVDSDVLETISITLCGDAVTDASETFTVTLSAPTGGAGLGSPTVATATINDVPPPLSGTYTVGSGGNYPSLTNSGGIFEALNLSGMSGQVFIDVISDLTGETGTHQLNDITAGNNLTIRPFGGPRSITGNSAASLIVINGADNVVIDGSGTDANAGPTVGGDSSLRNLTISNTNTGTSSAVLSIHTGTNGATNNTIKNVNVVGSGSTTGTLVGIEITGNTVGSLGTDNDNNRITNCSVQKSFFGIASLGASAANPNSQNYINRNDLSATGANSIGRVGIYVANEDGVQVQENSVGGINNALSADSIGLGIGTLSVLTSTATSGNVTNGTIYRNRINGIANTNTYSAVGIAAACTSCALANNMITGVISDGTSGDFTAGIFVVSGSGTSTNVFHNSVAMTGDRGATAEYPSYAMAINGTDTPVGMVNNVFYTSQIATGAASSAKSYAIGIVANNINFLAEGNAYWSTGANDGGFRTGSLTTTGNTDLANLAAWQAAISDDALAIEADPLFVDPTNDLHVQVASSVIGSGYNNQTPSVDFDNDPRPTTAPPQTNLPHPDIGADEIVQAEGGVVPAGSFYNASLLSGNSLAGNISVSNTLYLLGEVDAGSSTVSLGCNATVVGAGPSTYIVGAVTKDFCATGPFTFPIGTVSDASAMGTPPEYTPMTANVTALGSVPSSLTASVIDANMPGLDPAQAVSRYWSVTENGDLTADMTFQYLDSDINGSEINYKVYRKVGGGFPTQHTPWTIFDALNQARAENVSNFSFWGVGGFSPTSSTASISGRVMSSGGAGIKNAAIVITGNSLPTPKIAKTGSFGYYTVEGLQAGETYVVTVVSKRFTFQSPSRIISLTDSVTDIDFVANPEQ